jgi:hypothetical protein
MQRYNGWTNYDTWLVALWLHNDQGNDERLRSFSKDDIAEFGLDELQLFYYGDEVKWSEVNIDEIINNLLEE